MSRPVASFLLAQVLVAGVVVAALFLGSGPSIVAGGQFTPTPTGTVFPTPTVTPTPFPPPTPTPGVTPTPTATPTPGPGPTAFDDTYATPYRITLSVAAPGVLANDSPNGGGALTAQLVSAPAYGTLTLNANGGFTYVPTCVGAHTFTYRASNTFGASNVATATITVQAGGAVQPPCDLYVASVSGNNVTLRWERPSIGPVPTGFQVEGGVTPGQTLAAIPTGNPYPIFSFAAPSGSFFVRTGSFDGALLSVASNEVPLHVNVPVPPSPPASLVGLANGSALTLAWRNTFGGAPPTSLLLDVSGAIAATLPLGLTDAFSFPAVPPGTYTFRLRASNAAGVSAVSNAVTLSFPGACSGAPNPPSHFLAYATGSTVTVLWDPPATGSAPTSYLLGVTGAFTGTFPTTGRTLSGAVGAGTYGLSVRAANACGTSAATAVQTITVP